VEARVPIGETLAQARQQAGLTVTQVGRQTRIRETIIRKIEQDDYSECGGDFYARGHIRAIAKAVGTDPVPLIQEYDARYREPGAIGTISLEELLTASGRAGQRHPPDLPAVRARVAAAAGSARRSVTPAAAGGLAPYRPGARRRTLRWATFVGLALAVVVLGFVALHVLAGSPPKAAPSAAGQPAGTRHSTGHSARHGQPGPAAKASHRAPSPAPGATHSGAPAPPSAQPAQPLAPVQATAFGPNGGDNPQLAHLVLGGGHTAGWHTDWYASARFGNLYPGTGLLLDMGREVTITGAEIDLGTSTGASFQLRVGARPGLASMPRVAHASGAGGLVRLHLASPARGRYVLVWFTRLPADSSGTFQARIDSVTLQGRP
jgi:transcriptional regulator with XRE-family HTH domain